MMYRISLPLVALLPAFLMSASAFQLANPILGSSRAGRLQAATAVGQRQALASSKRIRPLPSLSSQSFGGLRMSGGATDFDIAVVGGGPAGLSLSANLAEQGHSVVCFDPALQERFIPNYGVWLDEVEPLGLKDCLMTLWPKATVFLGGAEGDYKHTLDRPYGRLDRGKIKDHFVSRCNGAGVQFKEQFIDTLEHAQAHSTLKTQEGEEVTARLVVDCTGHSKRFMQFEEGKEPGFQAAYGIEAEIEPGTYPLPNDEMLLMDYRDVHMEASADKAESEAVPTFIYCMPASDTKVFFEETSLIANPPVPFEDLKRRLHQRLELWGTKIKHIEEEEFCLIPMGGSMPVVPQRVVGFGGSAGLVHPATGYMISRTLGMSAETAASISTALKLHPEDSKRAAEAVWGELWNDKKTRQRDFAAFGGEYLESIGLTELREFFGAFFVLPFEQWGGFLSHRLVEPYQRLVFGLGVWANTSNRVRFSLALKGFLSGPEGWYTLGRSVLAVDKDDEKEFPTPTNQPAFFKMSKN